MTLLKFVKNGGSLAKNEKRLFYDETEKESFIVLVDFDETDDESIAGSFECGYYFSSRSFRKAYKELIKKEE